jgi:DNA-binding transcriptional LysR family regulator
VLAAVARAEAVVDRLRGTPRGEVRVALFPSGARMLLPGLLARLDAVPDVVPRCRDVDLTPADVRALTADFDVVVAHRDEHGPPHDAAGRLVVPLLREPLDVVLPPGHPLARRRRLRLEDLAARTGSACRSGGRWTTCCARWPCAPAPPRASCSGSTTSR